MGWELPGIFWLWSVLRNEGSMRYSLIICAGLVILFLTLNSCRTSQVTRNEIVDFIDDYEKKAEFLSRQSSLSQWQYYTDGRSDSLEYFQNLYATLISDSKRLSLVKKYRTLISDEPYRRKLDVIYRESFRSVIEHKTVIKKTKDSLIAVAKRYNFVFEGKPSTEDRLRQILSTDKDRFRRCEVYKSLTSRGDKLAGGLETLARLRNQAAARLGYNSYYDLMLMADGIEKTEHIDFLNELDRLTSEPYKQALDSLAESLNLDDLQIWDIEYALNYTGFNPDTHYPKDNQLSLMKGTFRGLGFNIGAWPIYFAPKVTTGDDPGSRILPVNVPDDIRIITDIKSGYASLSNLFAQVGRAIYAVHIDKSDFLLAQAPAPCFEIAMARIITNMIDLDSWKKIYAGIPEQQVMEMAARRDFRRLFNLRMNLVHLFFERELYADPYADLTRKYSEIFEKYLMIPCNLGIKPWAARTECIDRPVTIQNNLLAECITAQTYSYLKKKYGSVLDNQHTREFLVQNYYRFGRSEDWQTLLARGTGEKLNPRYILEYCGI
jgi:hypothetical protein